MACKQQYVHSVLSMHLLSCSSSSILLITLFMQVGAGRAWACTGTKEHTWPVAGTRTGDWESRSRSKAAHLASRCRRRCCLRLLAPQLPLPCTNPSLLCLLIQACSTSSRSSRRSCRRSCAVPRCGQGLHSVQVAAIGLPAQQGTERWGRLAHSVQLAALPLPDLDVAALRLWASLRPAGRHSSSSSAGGRASVSASSNAWGRRCSGVASAGGQVASITPPAQGHAAWG